MKSKLMDSQSQRVSVKVIGVGSSGCNIVEYLVDKNLDGVNFICADTDMKALKNSSAHSTIQIGKNITKGLGAGATPEIGRKAALEDREHIQEILEGSDLIFLTAGMGGGTGTGAAPIVAQVAKEMGILTVAIVMRPFPFEGKKRSDVATDGIEELKNYVDSLIVTPNEKLLKILGKNVSLLDSFNAVNEVIMDVVQGITELITHPGLINIDIEDIRMIMSKMDIAMMGAGVASGKNRARKAAEAAIASPFLEDVDFLGASAILVNLTAGMDITIGEYEEVTNTVKKCTSDDTVVLVGTVIDPDMSEEIRVTIITAVLDHETATIKEQPVKLVVEKINTGDVDYDQFDKPTVIRNKIAGDRFTETEDRMDYLDIPAFLRRGTEPESQSKVTQKVVLDSNNIRFVTFKNIDDEEIAELIVHLSNVYRSVGGDELIVNSVNTVPPNLSSNKKDTKHHKQRAAR